MKVTYNLTIFKLQSLKEPEFCWSLYVNHKTNVLKNGLNSKRLTLARINTDFFLSEKKEGW